MRRLYTTGLLALAFAVPASAQFYGGAPNNANTGGGAYGVARGLSGSADQGGQLRNFSVSEGGGGLFGGGGNGWGSSQPSTPWSSKYGGWIQEANSGLTRDGIARQQAWIQGSMQLQDYEQRRLELKRATFNEMMYEKMNTPPEEVTREEIRQQQLTRARNTPPDNEITNGTALNTLLTNISRIEAREGVRGYSIPVDQDAVKHLNVSTTDDFSGSNQLFKANQEPDWPVALQADNFAPDRKRIHDDFVAMIEAQQAGKVNAQKADDARRAVGVIREKLYGIRFNVSFSDYSGALQGLSKLEDAIGVMGKPGGQNYLNGTYSAKGNTVAEIVDYMISKGLRFAPATPGSEPYYMGFYQQLVTYDISLAKLLGDRSVMTYRPSNEPTPVKKDE